MTIKKHFEGLDSPVANLAFELGEIQGGDIEIMRKMYRQARSVKFEKIPPDEERIFAEPTYDYLTKDDVKRIMKQTREMGKWDLKENR